jgi:hypothetical protein
MQFSWLKKLLPKTFPEISQQCLTSSANDDLQRGWGQSNVSGLQPACHGAAWVSEDEKTSVCIRLPRYTTWKTLVRVMSESTWMCSGWH